MTQADPPAYPSHWEADVLLRDGRTANIRPVTPADEELLVDFYDNRVSDTSKYYRFFSPMPHLSQRDVERFTHVDYVSRVAFVLMLRQRMIAIGRYDVVAPGEAEVAFLVSDEQLRVVPRDRPQVGGVPVAQQDVGLPVARVTRPGRRGSV